MFDEHLGLLNGANTDAIDGPSSVKLFMGNRWAAMQLDRRAYLGIMLAEEAVQSVNITFQNSQVYHEGRRIELFDRCAHGFENRSLHAVLLTPVP
jgi:hypothetical protein